MRALLVSTYELGHQPLHVASPAASIRQAGHEVRCLDLSVDPFDPGLVDWADAVAFSVPMHTAMRLAMQAAREVRTRRPELPVCLYGLYAPVSRDLTVGSVADRVIAGEYEPGLLAWLEGVDGAPAAEPPPEIQLGRGDFSLPARDLLPPLERYARLAIGDEEHPVGYVEATHGCRHRCRHCPLPTVYDGALRVVARDTVVEDIARLASMGARHITFGDADFLNGPGHSLRIVRAMHERLPELTFDCTVKVEHILDHAELWPELAASGCLFAVSAVETLDDATLVRLDKGHTAADAAAAVELLREHGIEPRPTFLPFTPWTTVEHVLDLLDFVVRHDLVGNVDPVQYSLRLLLPEGSLLLEEPDPELEARLGPYDAERLTYTWTATDPMVDLLQARLAALVEQAAADGEPAAATFASVWRAARQVAGLDADPVPPLGDRSTDAAPRLTEPWFCCAEPTEGQLGCLGGG